MNSRETIKLPPEEQKNLDKIGVKTYTFPATLLAIDTAGTDLASNMAIVGAISAITQLTNLDGLNKAVKERFLGKGFVVSGGTAALDSVVERKFKHKQELMEKNMASVKAGWDYAMTQGWVMGKLTSAASTTA